MKIRKIRRKSIFIFLIIVMLLMSTAPLFSATNEYNASNLPSTQHTIKTMFSPMKNNKPSYTEIIPKSYSDILVDTWDWRNRHDANDPNSLYYDNDPLGTGWITPAKDQYDPQPCGSCVAFAAVGQTEAMINLYFNKHLDYDLSEQQIYSCGTGPLFDYIRDFGVINESVFPYVAEQVECNYTWNPAQDTLVQSSGSSYTSSSDQEKLKRYLIENGPLYTGWDGQGWGSAHAILIVGYGTIEAGDNIIELPYANIIVEPDSPRIGEPYWIIKNSYGPEHQDNGFFNLSLNQSYFICPWAMQTPLSITVDGESIQEVEWHDKDGDGYYNWGIGPKPEECPDDVPDKEDGNDNNSHLGPLNDGYHCTVIGENIVIKQDEQIILSKEKFDFGLLTQQYSKTVAFTIENPGTQPLTLTGNPFVTIEGVNSDKFEVIQQPSSNSINPGESVTFKIRFSPGMGTGFQHAIVSIQNDDPYANPYIFTISGKKTVAYNFNTFTWYSTIQDAIDDANDNDLIYVLPGEYYINGKIVIDKPVTLKSLRGPAETIINGSDEHQCFEIRNEYATLNGFTITHAYNKVLTIYSGTVKNCIMRNNTAYFGGGIAILGDCLVQDCFIVSNYAEYGGGIFILPEESGHIVQIKNCLIQDNHASVDGGGLYLFGFLGTQVYIDLTTITNNTAEESGGGIYANYEFWEDFNSVTNSIVYFNEVEGSNEQDNYNDQVNFGYSCTTPLPEQGKGNIDDDPVFINTGSRPYSLHKSSPCINAGDPDDLILPLFDLAGKPRLVAGRVDMGAYEFQKKGHSWSSVSKEEEPPDIE